MRTQRKTTKKVSKASKSTKSKRGNKKTIAKSKVIKKKTIRIKKEIDAPILIARGLKAERAFPLNESGYGIKFAGEITIPFVTIDVGTVARYSRVPLPVHLASQLTRQEEKNGEDMVADEYRHESDSQTG